MIVDSRLLADLAAPDRFDLAPDLAAAAATAAEAFDLPPAATSGATDLADLARRIVAAAPTEIVFRSSGSTGAPRAARHRLDDLVDEARRWARLLPRFNRVVALVPPRHIYGYVWTVLLPAVVGVAATDRRAGLAGPILRGLTADDLLVAHPARLAEIAQAPEFAGAAAATVVSSTAPLPADVAAAWRARGPVWEIYGASETGGIGWRAAPGPYRLLDRWRRAGDDRIARRDGACAVALPDRARWIDDERVEILGRPDRVVQVWGTNVDLGALERRLGAVEGVAAVAVRLMSPAEGARLKAFIVPAAGWDEPTLRPRLEALIEAELTAPERPRSLRFGPALPVGPLGKPADWDAAG